MPPVPGDQAQYWKHPHPSAFSPVPSRFIEPQSPCYGWLRLPAASPLLCPGQEPSRGQSRVGCRAPRGWWRCKTAAGSGVSPGGLWCRDVTPWPMLHAPCAKGTAEQPRAVPLAFPSVFCPCLVDPRVLSPPCPPQHGRSPLAAKRRPSPAPPPPSALQDDKEEIKHFPNAIIF